MADHAVGGVDRFVECGAREPGNGQPQHRRHDRIGEILGKAFDRRAGDAGFVERCGIAADDVRYCGAAGGEVVGFERDGDIGDVPVQAALRDQACWPAAAMTKMPNGRRKSSRCTTKAIDPDNAEEDQNRDDAAGAGAGALRPRRG